MTVITIFISSVLMLASSALVGVVFFFEVSVFASVLLLVLTGKTERIGESTQEMLVWAMLGSFSLITGLILYTTSVGLNCGEDSANLLAGIFLLLGFFVKVPVWPFTS